MGSAWSNGAVGCGCAQLWHSAPPKMAVGLWAESNLLVYNWCSAPGGGWFMRISPGTIQGAPRKGIPQDQGENTEPCAMCLCWHTAGLGLG